ncbi:hypothetical protein EJ913_01685 [Azospirillum doebereinerae]|uniref:Uncharacterized protein n=1 Tax=Azospirillum doebereinerae TaxID=92933 RepID=A0A433JFC2_9PROT|nr:hypothetical protein EJ913_01685 [Azospirillum doebereinerae]
MELLDPMGGVQDYADTAAIIAGLDLVIGGGHLRRPSGRCVGEAGVGAFPFRRLLALASRPRGQPLVPDPAPLPPGAAG